VKIARRRGEGERKRKGGVHGENGENEANVVVV